MTESLLLTRPKTVAKAKELLRKIRLKVLDHYNRYEYLKQDIEMAEKDIRDATRSRRRYGPRSPVPEDLARKLKRLQDERANEHRLMGLYFKRGADLRKKLGMTPPTFDFLGLNM